MAFHLRTAATTFFAPSAIVARGLNREAALVRIFLPSSTFVPSRRTTSGTVRPSSLAAATTPFAMTSHFMMPPKMLTKMAFTLELCRDHLEGLGDLLLVRAAADVEEVRRRDAVAGTEVLDDVHRRHRQARAVDQAADVAVERYVVEARGLGLELDGVLFVAVLDVLPLGVAKFSVIVEVDLRVERDDVALLGDDKRIDLAERTVLARHQLVEGAHQLYELGQRLLSADSEPEGELTRLVGGETDGRVDVDGEDLLRRLGGDLFDLDAAFGGRHEGNHAGGRDR